MLYKIERKPDWNVFLNMGKCTVKEDYVVWKELFLL